MFFVRKVFCVFLMLSIPSILEAQEQSFLHSSKNFNEDLEESTLDIESGGNIWKKNSVNTFNPHQKDLFPYVLVPAVLVFHTSAYEYLGIEQNTLLCLELAVGGAIYLHKATPHLKRLYSETPSIKDKLLDLLKLQKTTF